MICYFDGKFTEEENLKFIKMEQIGLFYSDYIIYDALYKATNRINNKMEVKQKE